MTDENTAIQSSAFAERALQPFSEAETILETARGEDEHAACGAITELLARVGDAWTVQTIRALGSGPVRFNALRRQIEGISQKMMTVTLRRLERDGFVSRRVIPTVPKQVEYSLTDLGRDLLVPVSELAAWTIRNRSRIEGARLAFDRQIP